MENHTDGSGLSFQGTRYTFAADQNHIAILGPAPVRLPIGQDAPRTASEQEDNVGQLSFDSQSFAETDYLHDPRHTSLPIQQHSSWDCHGNPAFQGFPT